MEVRLAVRRSYFVLLCFSVPSYFHFLYSDAISAKQIIQLSQKINCSQHFMSLEPMVAHELRLPLT